jgi:DNA-binding transcriptional MocR family regulator
VDGHGRCFPGRTRLARLCGMSARSVDAAVQELRDVGALEARSRWVDGAGQVYYERGQGRTQTSTEYTLLALARAPQDVRRAGHAQAPHDVPPNESPSCNEREFTSRQAKSQRPNDPWEIYSDPPARHLATTAEGKPIPGSQNW